MILLPPPPHFLMFTLPLLVQISSPVFFFSFWAHGCVFRFLISSRGLKFCNFLDFKLSLYSFYLRYRIIFLLWSSHLPLVFYALYSLSLFFSRFVLILVKISFLSECYPSFRGDFCIFPSPAILWLQCGRWAKGEAKYKVNLFYKN